MSSNGENWRYIASQVAFGIAILLTLGMAYVSYVIGQPVAVILALGMAASVGSLAYSNFKRHS